MDRRAFLGAAVAAAAAAQVSAPKKAKITSSVALWTMRGSFEDRLRAAALAGLQSVAIGREHERWTDEQIVSRRRLLSSYGFTTDALQAGLDINKAVAVARRLDALNVIVAGSVESQQMVARSEGITFLTDSEEVVAKADSAGLRLIYDVAERQKQDAGFLQRLPELLPITAAIQISAPEAKLPYEELYKTIAKAGYEGVICFAYPLGGAAVASLIRSVELMRANTGSPS